MTLFQTTVILQNKIKNQYIFTTWLYCLLPRAWIPDPEIINFKILVEDFMGMITMRLIFFHTCGTREFFFENWAVYIFSPAYGVL